MIKKIFSGFILAIVFGLLILGAVNRTIAKTIEREPIAEENHLSLGEILNDPSGEWSEEDDQPSNGENSVSGRNSNTTSTAGKGTGYRTSRVETWLEETGVVESVDDDRWIITLSDGTVIEVEGQTLNYLNQINFPVEIGDSLELTGFIENEEFKIGKITNLSTNQSAEVRDELGYPMWSSGRR
jgi:hypothetical protein